MSLWGSNSANAAHKPKYLVTTSGNGEAMGDLTPRCSGITATAEQANHNIAHAGWVLATVGVGSLTSVNVTAAGHGYANGEHIIVTTTLPGAQGAVGTITTNASGNVASVTLTATGFGYGGGSSLPVITANTVAGVGATFVAVVTGGRVGRTSYEVLVAGGSLT